MDRSLRFRVYALPLRALLRLAFATAPPIGLTLRQRVTRRPIMQKVRGRALYALPLLVDVWFQVLFHSPNRGAFHLSLAVLVHYRSVSNT